MSSAPAIGIDLGTTFFSAAVYRNGRTEVIPNKEGQRLTPSYIFYNPHNLNVAVGTTADDLGVKHINNFLFDIKRIIGRKYDDVYIQQLKRSPEYKFNIVRGEKDMAEIEVRHDGVKVRKSPEEASSEILKYLRESASEYLGTDVTEAVISIPAHFSNAQRKTTRAAAELAGFKVLKLITEPVAAAIHYVEERLETQGTLLVFDFGGGTLDVSIIEVEKNAFKVKSVEGDTFLGGRNFDQILLDYFKADIISIFGSKVFTDRLLRRVKKACTKLKIKLSTEEEYFLPLTGIGGDEDTEYYLRMTRAEFEKLTAHLLIRALNLVDKCISEAGLSKSDIHEVVLVGGTTRIPKVRSMLTSYFNNKKLKTDLNPDEAVALGAAVQAAVIKEKHKDLEKYQVTEITPLSLGLKFFGDTMTVFIKKNTPLPFKSQPFKARTVENNQEIVRFEIYEGERKNCNYNNLLGFIYIDNLPPGQAGSVTFNIIFSLNEDGILEFEAFENSSNHTCKLAVTVGEYRLCDYKIKSIIQDAEQNKREDDMFEEFSFFRYMVFKECTDILYNINNIPSPANRLFVESECRQLRDYTIISTDYTNIKDFRREYHNFKQEISRKMQGYIDVNIDSDDIALRRLVPQIILFGTDSQGQINQTNQQEESTAVARTRRRRGKRKVKKSTTLVASS